ncbi:MAG: glycosyl hydrolase 115 family protein [Suipraeoptans sp.]
MYNEKGEYHFEGYLLAGKEQKLFIIGCDKRGIMFGIYDLCRQIGVSPWHFFADVPVKMKEYWEVPAKYRHLQYPLVKFRGVFINDEEELENWSKIHTADNTIGPETYRHIFDLLLRLRVNYIWPAMHVNYFNENPGNRRLAHEMGIIVGTCHCNMLMRSNHNEWKPWLASKGYSAQEIAYDYSIEGFNRGMIREYWDQGVKMYQDYEVSYTVGMRGIHDSGFTTQMIDGDRKLSEDERFTAKSRLLRQVIDDQRAILSNRLKKPVEDIPPIFVPYKEVLEYYDHGLEIPEDITIIWTNDNYGYVRRYPEQKESRRRGGHGLYYHSSYWEATNMHYLFISYTPLARMKNELRKSWDNGIRKLWVLNIGSIKPLEQDIEFYTRYAWEVGREKTTEDIEEFLVDWIDLEFTSKIGKCVGKLRNQFTQVVNVRKIELLERNVFSQICFGDEGAMHLAKLKNIFDEVNEIADSLLMLEREAFFSLCR